MAFRWNIVHYGLEFSLIFLSSEIADDSKYPRLHFIIFVPPKDISPLFIQTGIPPFSLIIFPEISSPENKNYHHLNSFTMPQWGGISILNPKSLSSEAAVQLLSTELENSAKILFSQLRLLLGLPSYDPQFMLPNPESGLASWEFQLALRRNLEGTLQSAVSTLKAAVGVAHNLTNIKIPDEISRNCYEALEALQRVRSYKFVTNI